MSFVDTFDNLPNSINSNLEKFIQIISPINNSDFGEIVSQSTVITRRHFGNTMRLFAPLYLSNECVNNCTYCGFSRSNPILRVTLTVDQVVSEAKHLHSQGFRSILLVAGEHPKFVSSGYLQECIYAIKDLFPSIALEIAPMKEIEYESLVNAGCEALVVYQETYNKNNYKNLHTSGPKKNFNWRLKCPERAYNAGFRRIGIGALFGLSEWRKEALSLAAHLDYLQRVCWKANYTVSFPRIRPAAGQFHPEYSLSDKDFIQLVCAFRICFPDVGIVLSTRETEKFRDILVNIGITTISAGSHTEPGGYTGEGKDDLHYTVGGKRVEINEATDIKPCSSQNATEQFEINDQRSPADVCEMLKSKGLDPVWKDWDTSILSA
ncbi:MAG: 2-iminoacetate synthase ThiH [Verrucomicrobiales bacterium]|nr:2-iminoacetate synthase ThiH [Verrucomicrobiales bacterium]